MRLAKALLALAVFAALLSLVVFEAVTPGLQYFALKGGQLRLQDLAYHLLLVREWWSGSIDSIYSFSAQTKALSSVAGQSMNFAMPVGVTPLALLIWYPFSQLSFAAAHAAWIGVSLTIFCCAIMRIISQFPLKRWWIFGAILILFLSPAFGRTLILGQSSLWALGLLLLLVDELRTGSTKIIYPLCLLLLLSIKPSYMFVALVLLLARGNWRLAGIWFAVSAAVVCALLGVSGITEYLHALATYSALKMPEMYQGANSGLPNLRAILPVNWPVRAIEIGSLVMTLMVAAADRKSSSWAPLTLLAVLAALFFAPYSGRYELLLLFLPAIMWILNTQMTFQRPKVRS